MQRKRRRSSESDPISKIREAFRERLTRLWLTAQHTPRDAVNAVCTAGLAAAVTQCPTPEALSAVGLGVISNIVFAWLASQGQQAVTAEPANELIEQLSSDEGALREITSFLRKQNLLGDHNIFSSRESQESFSRLLLQGLQEYEVATREDTAALKSSLAELREIANELLTRVQPQLPTEPSNPFAVPFPGDRVFVGRENDLTEIHKMLGEGRPVGVRPAGLTGFGGIGKTMLAVMYAYEYKDEYPGGVYWVNAASNWVDGLAECARLAGLSEAGIDMSDLSVKRALAERLYRWLQQNPQSLLILDNIPEPGPINQPLFGDLVLSNLHCQIIFTTRNRAFNTSLFPSWEVKVLPREASKALLLSQRGKGGDGSEDAAADEICQMLGDLALAIQQAAAYLGKWPQIAIAAYRDRLACEGRLATADEILP